MELFENRGQFKAVEWRPWQKKMLEYVNNPTQRRIIWVVGEKGNEGKTFFQQQIEEQYGKHRVCAIPLTATARDILHCMCRYVDMETDIFLFNITRCIHHLSGEYYRLFESIKDGKATSLKYNTMKMRFTTPNVLIVFFYQRT